MEVQHQNLFLTIFLKKIKISQNYHHIFPEKIPTMQNLFHHSRQLKNQPKTFFPEKIILTQNPC